MKAGDKFWRLHVSLPEFFRDRAGDVFDNDGNHFDIPDSPALPAVARWIGEYGGALRYGQHTPGDWLDVVEATFDEQDDAVDRLMLQEQVVPALRALLAALTTEETA